MWNIPIRSSVVVHFHKNRTGCDYTNCKLYQISDEHQGTQCVHQLNKPNSNDKHSQSEPKAFWNETLHPKAWDSVPVSLSFFLLLTTILAIYTVPTCTVHPHCSTISPCGHEYSCKASWLLNQKCVKTSFYTEYTRFGLCLHEAVNGRI